MNTRIEKGITTRQHIVDVATLFTKSGYEATSIEAILSSDGHGRLVSRLREVEAEAADRYLKNRPSRPEVMRILRGDRDVGHGGQSARCLRRRRRG